MTSYEDDRRRKIEENNKRMEALNLPRLSQSLHKSSNPILKPSLMSSRGMGRGKGVTTTHQHISTSETNPTPLISQQLRKTSRRTPSAHPQTNPTPLTSPQLKKNPTPTTSTHPQTSPTPLISPPLQKTNEFAPSTHPQTRHAQAISQPLQNTSISAPSHFHSQSRHAQTICQYLQTAPASSSSQPQTTPTHLQSHSHSGTSIDMPQDPSIDNNSQENPDIDTSSLTPENINWGSKDRSDGRIWIRSAPGNNFDPEAKVRGAITTIFKENFCGAWSCWSDAKDQKEGVPIFWFNDFKAKFKWLPNDEANIKKSFNSRGSLALKNALFKVRNGHDEGDWIGIDNLKQLQDKWEEEKWQKNSMTNKQNRQSKAGHNVHSAGSISAREHAKKMRVELEREPTWFELYQRIHRSKEKPNEWFNETQAKIAEMYQTKMFERRSQSGEGSSQQLTQEFDNDIYMEIVGGINKKGRIFGLGSQAVVVKESSKSSPSISSSGVSSEKVAAMEAKIEALTAELEKKNLEQEMIKQKMEHLERIFGNFVPNMNSSTQPETTVSNENNGNNEMDER